MPTKKSPRELPPQPHENPAIREILGSDLCRAFDLLMIGTEEAERAGVLATMPSEMFMMLAPGDVFRNVHPDVYQSHVCELLGRFRRGERLDLGTAAEVLLGMVETSLRAPLNRGGLALYHSLFRRVLGEECYRRTFDDIEPPRERWKGQLAELEADARRKVRTGRPRKVPS